MLLTAEISMLVKVMDDASGLLEGDKENVELLKYQLKKLRPFLEDANNKQLEKGMSEWISEIMEVVHEAEVAVEMLLVNAENGRMSSSRVGKRDIDSIRVKLDGLHKKYNEQVMNRRTEEELRYGENEEQSQVVGMEDDVEKLLKESIRDEKRKGLSIAVVEGMVGIGKTTLARKIYNLPDVVARFECRAWVTVSSRFSLEGTMKQLILQLPSSSSHEEKPRELQSEESKEGQEKLEEMLHTQLKGKTYFIVLDDVWETEHWESLWTVFPREQDKSSRLLVTTRNKYIATDVDRYTRDEMKLLDPEKSWELLLMKARCSKELEPIGREIVKRCNGLPLAISLVGGLLDKTPTKTEWEHVLNLISSHRGWEVVSNLNSSFTRSDLSYQNLSQKLKSCFVCLAFFKEDAIIPAQRLLHIWIGLGLIQQDYIGMTLEEVGRGYLDELINRNILQIVDCTDNRVESCYLHGVLRDVCLRRANEEICWENMGPERVIYGPFYKPRHCVVNGGRNIETLLSKEGKYLRSLFLLNDEGGDVDMSNLSWEGCELLKILHLDGITLSTFPDSFQSFTRLKYLRIRRKTHLKFAVDLEDNYIEPVKLPSWLDHLTHLEILDMKGEKVKFPKDPDAALKMKRLRYFSAYCVGGPMSINSWDDIETLKYMRQEDWMKCFSILEFTCNVRKLGLFIDPFNPPHQWSKVRASLQELDFLEYLHLRWSPIIPINPEIVPKIPSLTKLKLSGKLAKCPTSSMFPPNLSRLTLAFSGLHEDQMAELSKLPNLSYLKLLGNAFKGQKMEVLPGGFLCLKALSLKEMFHLKYIHLKEGGMPLLEQLRIQQCPSLKTIDLPEHVTIKYIT